MNKSYHVLLSIIILAAIMLAACAPQPLPTAAPAPATAAPVVPTVAPAAPIAATVAPAAPAAATEVPATKAPAAAPKNVTLEFWTFSDYATDVGGGLMKTFISEFEAAHPGVKINMTGKGGDELNTGIVTSKASKSLPDVYMGTTSQGALFTKINAMQNVYDKWMAMPEAYRGQFNTDMIKEVTPKANTMYAIPFTGYATFLYRNLTVLKAAGIDPNEKVETWDAWLAQMKKIHAAGYKAMGSFYNDWWDFTNIYSGAATPAEWGIDFANKKTLINPDKYIQTVKFLEAAKAYGTENGDQDQATTDLFLSNKLAFIATGPWMDPTFLAAKSKGLDYDYVLIPGATPDNKGGVRGTEFIGFSPDSPNLDVAWEFASYICDAPQLTRWGEALGRFNANNTAIAKVKNNPLLQITFNAAPSSLFERPPHFVDAYPGNYYQVLQDNLAQITTGQLTPEKGAVELIKNLNDTIANQ